MEKISLEEAIRQIKCICDQHPASHPQLQHPFFFIIGAGVSSPSIPLSEEIIEDCKKKVPDLPDTIPKDPMEQYSFWIEKAYPSQESRRIYFTGLIKDKPITHAHLRLAHLLTTNKVANIIVTPNFDDLLSRALWLFEKRHITCDHPKIIERIDPGRNEIQIIHVHGNYLFYDLKNLKGEIKERSELEEKDVRMVERISSIMSQFSPIIVGYSGWENDIIMTALHRTIDEAAKNNIYWFCYQEEDCNSLPEFIKNNPYVKCVVASKSNGKYLQSADLDRSDSKGNVPYQKEQIKDITPILNLSAQQVFDAFNRGFECGLPELTEDPLGFFIKKLENTTPSFVSVSDNFQTCEQDLYSINMVIQKISRAKKCLDNQILESENSLAKIIDAVRKSDYTSALKIPNELDLSILDEKQLDSFINAVLNALPNLNNPPPEKITLLDNFLLRLRDGPIERMRNIIILGLEIKADSLYEANRLDEAVIALEEVLPLYGVSESPEMQVRAAKAFYNKGVVHGKLKQFEESIAAYAQVIIRYGESKLPVLQIPVILAFFNKGATLGELNRSDEAIAVWDDMITRYGMSESLEIQGWVTKAFLNKGVALGELNRSDEAIAVWDDMITRYGVSEFPEIQVQVAKATFNKCVTLGKLNRPEEEIAVYDEVVSRFGDSKFPEIQVQVAMALVNKGAALGKLNRPEEEIAVYDEVVSRFGESESQEIHDQLAGALFNKGVVLRNLNRPEEAVAVYDEVVSRFGDSKFPEIQVRVAMALVNKGVVLKKLNRSDEAVAVYDEVVSRFGDSKFPEIQVQVAMALVNKGVALGNLNRSDEAVAVYDEVISRFSESESPNMRAMIARAFVNKGIVLGNLNRPEEAVAVYDEVISRFGDSKFPEIQVQVAMALVDKGNIFKKMGDLKRAKKIYSDILKKFKTSKDPSICLIINTLKAQNRK